MSDEYGGGIEKKPFVNYTLQEEKDSAQNDSQVFTIRLNRDEINNLRVAQNALQQEKISTCIKQLVTFGMFVLQERSTGKLLEVLGNNIRKNKRTGIDLVELKPLKN